MENQGKLQVRHVKWTIPFYIGIPPPIEMLGNLRGRGGSRKLSKIFLMWHISWLSILPNKGVQLRVQRIKVSKWGCKMGHSIFYWHPPPPSPRYQEIWGEGKVPGRCQRFLWCSTFPYCLYYQRAWRINVSFNPNPKAIFEGAIV